MNKSVVLAVIVAAFAVVVSSVEVSIKNLKPANGAIVNECPTFSWSPRGRSRYTLTVFNKDTGKVALSEKTIAASMTISPLDFDKFLARGNYSWNVTTETGDISDTLSFEIRTLSCIPPKSDNKVDNSFGQFNDVGTSKGTGTVPSWLKETNETLDQRDGAGHFIKLINFTAYGNEKIAALKKHETYPDSAMPKTELLRSEFSTAIKPSIGDNIIAFRYMYYTTGNSTIYVELLNELGNREEYLGCIGQGGDEGFPGTDKVPCEADRIDITNTHFSPTLTDGKWAFFKRELTPRKNNKEISLRWTYVRAKRQFDDNQTGFANYLYFMTAITYGQCSSVRTDYYDYATTAGNLTGECVTCNDAGFRCPVKYSSHCPTCETLTSDLEACSTVSFCSSCLTKNKCEVAETSTCRSDAKCESKKTKQTCTSLDCAWCPLDEKCVFNSDETKEDVGCSSCAAFTDIVSCSNHTSNCKWCPTLAICVDKKDSCPECGFITDEESCTLETTYSACQFCHKQDKCLSVSQVCNEECQSGTSKETCTSNDCLWCPATQKCTEKRIECVHCANLTGKDACVAYPGCQFCDIGLCREKSDKCPVCGDRDPKSCQTEGGINLNCKVCESSQTCIAKSDECAKCSDQTDSDQCAALSGCGFCKSELVCRTREEGLSDCDCYGMSQSACTAHPKGCCWSDKDGSCFEVGDGHCKTTLSTLTIALIGVFVGVFVIAAAILIPVLIFCCKPKTNEGIEMTAPGTIVVLPEGQPSMVVAQESLASVNADPATAMSVDESASNAAAAPAAASMADMQNMQNMMAQQQMLNTMMAQQQMSMMMNPMMMNSMGMMNMSNMSGMAGMSGMNSMGMDMNSMNMTGGMNSMAMSGGMQGMMNGGNGMPNQGGM